LVVGLLVIVSIGKENKLNIMLALDEEQIMKKVYGKHKGGDGKLE